MRPDPSNAVADHPGAAALGQQLFFDAALSTSGGVSCATCHQPARGFTDGLVRGRGVGEAARHTPSVVGSQGGAWLFWDGRADSLWMQALGPIENDAEMASDRVSVVQRIATAYRAPFEAVFGPLPDWGSLPARGRPDATDPALVDAWRAMTPDQQDAVNRVFSQVGKAIAAYERRLVPQDAPFDRYADALAAGDPNGGGHLNPAAQRGLALFLREGGCVNCHNGPLLTDRSFHNLGLPEPGNGYDPGRTQGAMAVASSPFNCAGPYSDAKDCPELRYLNPTFPDFVSAFKTPTLRGVTQTAPYMHHGGLADLDAVLTFYSELPGQPLAGHRELTLRPLGLTPEQRTDLIAFLGALDGGPLPEALTRPLP